MRLLVVVALALLLAPVASGEPFLQTGYDAARTGDVPGTGPQEYEIAFTTDLPGAPVLRASPVIIDSSAYVLVHEYVPSALNDDPPSGLTENGLFRVDLETGRVDAEPVVALDGFPTGFASDGEAFYIAEEDRLAAYDLSGEEIWAWPWPKLADGMLNALSDQDSISTKCVPPAIDDGALYVACTHENEDRFYGGEPHQGADRIPTASQVFAARLALGKAGKEQAIEPEWLWEGSMEGCQPTNVNSPVGNANPRVHGLTVLGGSHVLLSILGPGDLEETGEAFFERLDALKADEGTLAWRHCDLGQAADTALQLLGEDRFMLPHRVTGTSEQAYVLHDELKLLDLESGDLRWRLDFEDPGAGSTDAGAITHQVGLALRGDALIGQAYGAAMRFSTQSPEVLWGQPQDEGEFLTYQPLLADATAYMLSYESLVARDLDDGSVLWKHTFESPPPWDLLGGNTPPPDWGDRPSVTGLADGVLVLVNPDGNVTAFGRTPASIHPDIQPSNLWPAPGERVTVDLSASDPGMATRDDLEYRADWGDETTSDWQDEPVFEHIYLGPGRETARFTVRNDAGQRSVETIGFDVGGSPPEELNFLQKAFARNNQDLTFGVLGIVVALAGGFIALGHRHSKRGRLQRELDAIERAYEATKNNQTECEAALTERKARCRGLLLDGALDEAQFAVLEKRIDELSRELRLSALDDRFDFLPFGLVKALRDMLSDGRISAWEREHVVRALEEDAILTKRQKQKVRLQVDRWFEKDTGVTA